MITNRKCEQCEKETENVKAYVWKLGKDKGVMDLCLDCVSVLIKEGYWLEIE